MVVQARGQRSDRCTIPRGREAVSSEYDVYSEGGEGERGKGNNERARPFLRESSLSVSLLLRVRGPIRR